MAVNYDRINLLPTFRNGVSYEQYTEFINMMALVLRWTSPIMNDVLGQVVPPAEFLRDGHLAYADGTNWNPTSNQYANVVGGVVTTAGGNPTETLTVSGVTTSDIAIISIKTQGATPVTILRHATVTGGIEVTFSSDPSNDHVLNYLIFRNTGKGHYYYDTSSGGSWRKLG